MQKQRSWPCSNLCGSTGWAGGCFLARSDYHCSTTTCLQNSILQHREKYFFLGLPLPTSSLNTVDWSWFQPSWSWTNLIGQESINLIGQDKDIQSKSSQSEILSLRILGTGTQTKPRSSLIHGSSSAKTETWKPGAVGRHSLGKVGQEGNWVMAEPLMWEVPKAQLCLHLSYDFWLFGPLLVCELINLSLPKLALLVL